MADPLSISASVAGLITIADIVIRRGYKYISAVRDADKAVANLVTETNLLYGTLHSLRNIAEGLERGNARFVSTTRVNHVEACYRTLQKITKILDSFQLATTPGSVQPLKNRLKWPLAHSETKSLLEEVRRHREVLSLALQADELSALIRLLARQDNIGSDISEMKRALEEERLQRKEIQMNEERVKMLDWLCPPNIEPEKYQKSAVCLRQAGTGVWFLDGDEFQEWQLSNNSALWIHGIPGAGKTILMSTIIQELQRKTRYDEGLAFYYCDYKDTNTHQPNFILGSIIKHLVLQKEEAIQLLVPFYDTHRQIAGRYRSPDPEPLLEQLHKTMDLFNFTTIVIDGLDEIGGDRWETIDLLRRIRPENSKIKIIFASRKETDIEECLSQSEYNKVSIVAQSSDLTLYVASEIEKRTKKRQLSIKDLDLKETIMNRLINGAEGMFRWVACQIDHLCELPNDRARSNALDNLPRGLDETYERILHRVLERHKDIHTFVARTLQWLAFSNNTLAMDSLLVAISVNLGDSSLDPTTIPSEDELLKWCSSLIRRQESKDGIEFAHFTVKEYLLSISTMDKKIISTFALSKSEANLYIGQTCLTYLLSNELGKAPPSDEIFNSLNEDQNDVAKRPLWLFSQQVKQYPLCSYASNQWHEHLRGHLEKHEIVQLTHKLFLPQKSNHFLWFSYAVAADYLEVTWRYSYSNTTTLHWAALLSLEEVCTWLIHQGCDINRTSLVGTPLNCALQGLVVLEGRSQLSEIYEPNVNLQPEQTKTAKALIDAGANIDANTAPQYNNYPPLAIALYRNFSDEILIRKLSGGGTAMKNSTLEIVQAMLCSDEDNYPTLVTLFSAVSHKNVPESCKERFIELSKEVSTVDLVVSKISNAEKEDMGPDERLTTSKLLFMQAVGHGMKNEVVSLISSVYHLVNEEELVQMLTEGLTVAVKHGHFACSEVLLSHGADPNAPDEQGNTALHFAMEESDISDKDMAIQNVNLLLKHGADFELQNASGELPLYVAAKNSVYNNFLRELYTIVGSAIFQLSSPIILLSYTIQSGSDDNILFLFEKYEFVDLNAHPVKTKNELLCLAALRETALAMDLLVKRGLHTNALTADGTSLLYSATISNSKEVFDYLMDLGLTDNSSKVNGWKAIHEAAKIGSETSTAKLAALLLAGEDPNLQTTDGSTALHFTMSSISSTQLLCSQERINTNIKNNNGLTPLMVYSEGLSDSVSRRSNSGPISIRDIISNISHLLGHKAEASCVDKTGQTALHYLLNLNNHGRINIVEIFETLRAIVTSGGQLACKDHIGVRPFDRLLEICSEAERRDGKYFGWLGMNFELVLKFATSNVPGESLNDLYPHGGNPLSFAILNYKMKSAKLILSIPEVDVDQRDRYNRTALEIAAQKGCNEDIARALLSRTKIPVHALNSVHGYGLLHYSVQEKRDQTMLKVLLERKVEDLQLLTRNGETPLQLAIMAENAPAVELLVEAGVDIHIPFSTKYTPLHLASSIGSLAIVRTLVENGADINSQLPVFDATPLHVASNSQKAQWDISSYLIEKGADVYALDSERLTPYHAASRAKRWDVLEEYMKSDTNLDKKTAIGWGLLEWAMYHGQDTSMKKLQQRGLNFQKEIRDKGGKLTMNSLMVAVWSGNEEAFEVLWDDDHINFTTDNGWTLAHFAVIANKNEVRNRLLPLDVSWNVSTATPLIAGRFMGKMATVTNLTPLHIAAWGGHDPGIKFLQENKLIADVNTLTLSEHRYSALHLATIFNRLSTVKLLHSYGLDLELADGIDHQTALHHAAKKGFHEIVSALLEAGCRPNEPDIHGMTPELLAIENGNQSVIGILSQHLDALEAKKSASQDDTSCISGDFHSLSTEYKSNSSSCSSSPSDTFISTNDLSVVPKKPWRLPLHQGPNMRKIITDDVSIYAINEKEGPEELRKMLEKHEGKDVIALGKPYRRLI